MPKQSVPSLLPRRLAGFGDVPAQHQAPVAPVHLLAVLGGGLLGEAPLQRQRLNAGLGDRADGQHPRLMLAGQRHPGRADQGGDGKLHALLRRFQLQLGVAQGEPVRLMGDALIALEQAADDADGFILAVAQQHGINAEHVRIGWQGAWPRAENDPPPRLVIELHEALRHHEWMVIGQRDNAGAELDARSAFSGGGEEQFRRSDHLPAGGVVLAAPKLVEPKTLQVLHKRQVAL